MPAPGTKPMQIRLSEEDKAAADRIADHLGVVGRAAAIRHALRQCDPARKAPEKIPRKSAQGG